MAKEKKFKWYRVYESIESANDSVQLDSVVKVMVGEQFLCFTRTKNGFFAFGDKCPHQGKPLVQASCNEKDQVVCPFHQYNFDLHTGRGEGLYLPVYPVKTSEEGIFVGVEKSPWQIF